MLRPTSISNHSQQSLGRSDSLRKRDHQLADHCQHCDRRALLDSAAMIDASLGDRRLPITARCHVCGELGCLQIRPPVPMRSGIVGWSDPPALQTW
jgi:hypothetical protein